MGLQPSSPRTVKDCHIPSYNLSHCPQISSGLHKQSKMQRAEYSCSPLHWHVSKSGRGNVNRESCGLGTLASSSDFTFALLHISMLQSTDRILHF